MSEIAVSLKEVGCKIAGKPVIEGITLTVGRGDVVGVLGPNGAGKTTLLSLVTGLKPCTSGELVVLGQKMPARTWDLARRIGVVLQETALYEELTAFENLEFAAALYDVPDTGKRIAEVLELLMLCDRSKQVVKTLSGGLKRRVAIARALLHKPELLIVDEPTLGVDVEARHAIWSHLRLLRCQGTTILASTNYLDEAQALCSTVAVLRQGRLVTMEAPDALTQKTGTCLDVECAAPAADLLAKVLADKAGILRVEPSGAGLTVFVHSGASCKEAMELIMKHEEVQGLHRRAPDLAEVFKALDNA